MQAQHPPPQSTSSSLPRTNNITNSTTSSSSSPSPSSSRPTKPPSSPTASSSSQPDPTKSNINPTTLQLQRLWRTFASSVVVAARNAERDCAAAAAKKTPSSTSENNKPNGTAVNDALVAMLKARAELRRLANIMESQLNGYVKEGEVLENGMRGTPCVGMKKRVRGEM